MSETPVKETAKTNSFNRVDLLGIGAIALLNGAGLFAYLFQRVLVPSWLWDNPDYMLYLGPAYYHLHVALLIGHLYGWGLFLIWKQFDKRLWSLYWASFAVAYVLTAIPLLSIQRFKEIYGVGAFAAVVSYYGLLFIYWIYHLIRRRSRLNVIAFHLFSGYPIVILFLQNKRIPVAINTVLFWTLLLFHVAIVWYLWRSRRDDFANSPTNSTEKPRAVFIGNVVILLLAALLCIPHHLIQVFYARLQLDWLLDSVNYAAASVIEPVPKLTLPENHLKFRTYDGSWNNLRHPEIGMASTPLGRYMPESGRVPQDVNGEPSVIKVSDRLLRQGEFKSAAPINSLAMAWVNFFVHDFYNRGVADTLTSSNMDSYAIPVGDDQYMYMGKLPTKDGSTHISKVTHWFDASQVYGSDEAMAQSLRTHAGGKLKIGEDGFLPVTEQGLFLTGDTPRSSLQIGPLILHHLWVVEHNYITDQLHQRYPKMTDEELYQTARLIVAAEIVKVHTVEWSAQLVADPVSVEFLNRFWQRFGKAEYRDDLWYAVSEEFISSYILHEIVPPTFTFVDQAGKEQETVRFVNDLFLIGGQDQLKKHGIANVFNSFGLNPMGIIYPFNIPEDFRRFEGLNFLSGPGHEKLIQSVENKNSAGYLDLGAIPIARDRDARVPKYNDLRQRLTMPRLKSIKEVSSDPEVVQALEDLYDNVDQIEYIIGFKAESRPSNWGLTPTQLNTFLPVVTYRIIADRFYTRDFNEEFYTPYGMERLRDVRLYDIIKNCYGPSLLPADRDAPIFYLWKEQS